MTISRSMISLTARVVMICVVVTFASGCDSINLQSSQPTVVSELRPLTPSAEPIIVPTNVLLPLAEETNTPVPRKQATLTPTPTLSLHHTWQGPLLALYANETLLFDLGANQIVPIRIGWPILGWSPDGCQLASERAYIVNISTFESKKLLASPFVGGTVLLRLAWAPTSEWIAYTDQSQSGGSGGISVIRPDRTQKIPLVASGILAGWSSDGQEVLFWSSNDGVTAFHAINVNTLGTKEIVQLPPDFHAVDVSPDGQYAVVSPYDYELGSRWKLYLLDIQTGQSHALYNEWLIPGGLSWAPDSKTIAFGAKTLGPNAEDKSSIYLMDVTNGTYRVLATSADEKEEYVLGYPSWSPDGKKLAFLGSPSPWVYDFETEKLIKLLPEATLKTNVSWYSPMLWSPRLTYGPEACH